MLPKYILIVNIRSLLIEGVKSLLEANKEFVVASTLCSDHIALIREVEELKPDVIIIDEITSFTKPTHLIASLLGTQKIRLITVNNHNSTMKIYDKYEHSISSSDQFIAASALNVSAEHPH